MVFRQRNIAVRSARLFALMLITSITAVAFQVTLSKQSARQRSPKLLSSSANVQDAGSKPEIKEQEPSPLSMNLNELSSKLRGKGKAQVSWDCFKAGIDPLLFHNPSYPEKELDNALNVLSDESTGINICKTTTRQEIQQHLPLRRQTQTLGEKALKSLSKSYPSALGIEPSLASLSQITRSGDGTTKLLLKLTNTDFFIETVIIPHYDWNKSTLCISSQVGCAQGCVFCATGKMGKLASLTTDQILIQLYFANKICRLNSDLPQIDNIVFMGMGEAGDNIDSVRKAVDVMTDRSCFALAPSKITISTVGPNPEVFSELTKADAVLAWSIHAVRDDLRKKLVPTTKHSMKELGDGVVRALRDRSKRLRNLMLEVTLMDGINDGIKEAEEMATYALDLMNRVDGMKLMINLIPFNDIGYAQYRRASDENVAAFQKVLVDAGVKAYVRTTRGDDESAACGQLATKKRQKRPSVSDIHVAP